MAVTSKRGISINFDSDIHFYQTFSSAENIDAPGDIDIIDLINGNNTITFPVGGIVVLGATIIPPAGNAIPLFIKGVAGDTGVRIHETDPTSIALSASGASTFVIQASGGIVTGLRIIWT